MNSKSIIIAGLITADHVLLKTDKQWNYLGSMGGGSAANVYFTLKSFNLPVRLIGPVGNKNPSLLKTALRDIENNSKFSNFLHISKNSETREYYHLIERRNSHWKHKFSSSSPVSGKKQHHSVQFRKSYFIHAFNNALKDCELLYMDRLSKGLLDFAQSAKERKIPLIFDFGTISTRYFKEEIIRKAIKLADIIQIPKKIYDFLLKQLNFKSFQDINPKISIWIITDGKNPVIAYHSRIGQLKVDVPELRNIIESGGAGDAFMSMLIKQFYEIYKISKSFNNIKRRDFIDIIKICIKNAQLACSFIGARTYIYEYLNNHTKIENFDNFIEQYEFKGNYLKKSMDLIENFGKKIQEIDDEIINFKNLEEIKFQKGNSIFESNLLNIPSVIEYSLNQYSDQIEIKNIKNYNRILILVGSGASYSVAKAIEQLFYPPNKEFSVYAFTPFEYILKINQPFPICIISYSGTNPDVKNCYKKAVYNDSKNIFLLTGRGNSLLKNQVKNNKNGKIIFVKTPKKESGFVGVYSMIASLCVLAKFLYGHKWKKKYSLFLSKKNISNLIKECNTKIKNDFLVKLKKYKKNQDKFHIVALGTNWANPALIDLESKVVECNLGTIEISELKNFTHGRYINLYKNFGKRIVVIFDSPETRNLTNFLEEKLAQVSPIFKISTESDDFIGMVELIIKMFCFINQLGKYYELDPSKPGFPNEAKGLFNWDGLYG